MLLRWLFPPKTRSQGSVDQRTKSANCSGLGDFLCTTDFFIVHGRPSYEMRRPLGSDSPKTALLSSLSKDPPE